MKLDELTIGEAKQLAAMLGGGKGSTVPPTGRAVIVVDRGWIFAGDLSLTADGYIRLERAVHVFRWEGIGFAKMLTEWKSGKVDVRACEPVELPQDAVIFRVPVEASWGLK